MQLLVIPVDQESDIHQKRTRKVDKLRYRVLPTSSYLRLILCHMAIPSSEWKLSSNKTTLSHNVRLLFHSQNFTHSESQNTTRNILDCDQSNVLLMCIIFSCILLTAFWFLSFHTTNSGADSIASVDSIKRTIDVITSRDPKKVKTRDPIIFEVPYLHNCAR